MSEAANLLAWTLYVVKIKMRFVIDPDLQSFSPDWRA